MKVNCISFTKYWKNSQLKEISKNYYYYSFVDDKLIAINQINEAIDYLITRAQKFPLLTQIENLEFKLYYMNQDKIIDICLHLPGYKNASYYQNIRFALNVFRYSHI